MSLNQAPDIARFSLRMRFAYPNIVSTPSPARHQYIGENQIDGVLVSIAIGARSILASMTEWPACSRACRHALPDLSSGTNNGPIEF